MLTYLDELTEMKTSFQGCQSSTDMCQTTAFHGGSLRQAEMQSDLMNLQLHNQIKLQHNQMEFQNQRRPRTQRLFPNKEMMSVVINGD